MAAPDCSAAVRERGKPPPKPTSPHCPRLVASPRAAPAVSLHRLHLRSLARVTSPNTDPVATDIVVAVDGVVIGSQRLDCLLAAHADRGRAPLAMTVLRPKGEVPIAGATIEAVGHDRLRITPSQREIIDPRPPYVLIATDSTTRDEWLRVLEACAADDAEAAAGTDSSRRISAGDACADLKGIRSTVGAEATTTASVSSVDSGVGREYARE